MDVGRCPRCTEAVHAVSTDEFCCFGCFFDVKLLCSSCKVELEFTNPDQPPKFCDECGEPVNLNSVGRVAYQLGCGNCSEIILRKKNGDLPKFCSQCRWKIDKRKLRSRPLAEAGLPTAVDMTIAADNNERPRGSVPTTTTTTGTLVVSSTEQFEPSNRNHEPLRHVEVVETLEAAAPSSGLTHSPVVATAALTGSTDSLRSQLPFEPAAAAPSAIERPLLFKSNEDRDISDLAAYVDDAGIAVRSSIATEPWNTPYHEGAIVSRHTPAIIKAEILPESWSRGPPASTPLQTVAATVPKISNRLGPDATVLEYDISGRGINEIGAVNENRAVTVAEIGVVSPDFPYFERYPISKMLGPFPPFLEQDAMYHFDNVFEPEIEEHLRDFIEPDLAPPVLIQEAAAVTTTLNAGMEMVNNRSAKRKRRRWMRKDDVLAPFDTMSPHANHSAFRDEGPGRRHMAFFDADIDPLPEMFSPSGRPVSVETKQNAIPREYLDVYFHVVIPKSFSFDEKFDLPFIELYSHLPGEQPIRKRLQNHSLLSGSSGWTVVVRFSQHLCCQSQPLQYRYVVQHTNASEVKDTYEWIHKQAEGETCIKRHLRLSDISAGIDKWDQYDLVMLPESYAPSDALPGLRHPQSVLSRDAASKGVRASRHHGPGTLDNTDRTLYDNIVTDSIFGLNSMLPDFMYCITNGNMMASSVIECFEDVLNCVVNGNLFFLDDANRSLDQKRLHLAVCNLLVERARQQKSLGQRSMDQPVAGDKYSRLLRIVSGLVLMALSCLYQCDGVFEHLSGILASLSVAELSTSDVEDFVQKHFKNPSRVINPLRYFMMEAANSGDPSWLWAVPLYHAMQKWATSYDRRSTKYNTFTWWGLDPELGRCLPSFMAQARQFKVKDWYQCLSPMFRVSWLSARTLVGALNKAQLVSALREQFPLPIDGYTAAVLHKCLLRNPQRLRPEEGVSAIDFLRVILTQVCDSITQINNPSTTEPLLNSMEIIVDALFKAENYIDFRGWQLILGIARFFADLCKYVPPPVDKPFDTDLVMRFIDKIVDWLSYALNFPMAEVDATTFTNADELQMWQLLMRLEWHEKEIRQIWTLRLKQSLQHRLDKASHYTKVALYCLTDFDSSDVEEIFVAMALHAAGDVMRNTAKEIDYGENDDARKKYGKVFSFAFNDAWKRLSADDTKKIEFIYTWPRFPTYVSLICSDHALVLDQTCQSRMDECVKLVDERCKLLVSGGITYSDLNFMIQHGSQFVCICRLLSENQRIDERSASDIQKWLELRKNEKSAFDELHDNLRKFVAMCERIDKVQLLDLPRRLIEDLSKKPLSELWVPTQPDRPGILECRQFPFTKTVLTSDFLQLVKKVHESLLFMSYWTNAGKLFLKQREETTPKDAGLPIELKDVTTIIWVVAYGQYTDFVNRLGHGIATFGDADYLVQLCGGDSQRLSSRIATEVKLVMQSSPNWKEVCNRIVDYNKLRLYANGASVMRKLKNLFDLHGDFRALDVLITWDQDPSRKISEITNKLVEAGRRLGAMDDPAKVECLNAFVECKELIDWVKEHVTEPKELKVFVDLASIVAGEGDIEVEKVTCLHAAVIGYTPLIYELPQTADLQTFLEKCEAVWKSLEANKDLAIQLKDTARNIEFIKSVKDSYSSVEFTSLAQAAALNEKGTYTVGFVLHDASSGYLSNTLDSVVRAAVPDTRRPVSSNKEQLSQKIEMQMMVDDIEKKYSYSALSELQSKLMLVAGQAELDNPEVEEFVKMFRNITRLAQAYIRVNDVGTLLFEKWQMKFTNDFAMDGQKERIACSHIRLGLSTETSEVVEYRASEPECADHAAKLADLLEECANEWDEYVREQRQTYHELNFFTIRQIVFLRKELAKCLTSGDKVEQKCNNKVYPLLAMLAPCNWEDVNEALTESYSPPVDSRALSPKSDSVKVLNDNQGVCSSFDELVSKLRKKWKEFLRSRLYDAQEFISTERLGGVLRHLSKKNTRPTLSTGLARGQPHLVVCPEDDVLRALLSLYMVNRASPMPTRNEVLICSEQTSLEEVELLLQRALFDEVSLYSIVHAQRLSYDICGHIEKRIEEFQGLNRQYCIAVLCSEESEGRSRIVTALERFRVRRFTAEPVEKLRDFVQTHLRVSEGAGALIDIKKCSARVIRSNRAGVGKTLYVRRRITKLKNELPTSDDALSIQLLQQRVDLSALLRKFLDKCSEPNLHKCRLIHINISQEVQYGVDELLFNLLILGSLCHSEGYVWQRSKLDYYAIETVPLLKKMQTTDGEKWKAVHSVLELLPTLSCVSPSQCYQFYDKASTDSTSDIWWEMDDQVFNSEEWQRTYQYLIRNRASFQDTKDVNASSPEGSPKDMLRVLLDECKLHDPSWCELRNFVSFLNMQLLDCERSAFCSAAAREDLPRFLEFVVSFMLDMSRDFATRSLVISEESPEAQQAQLYRSSGETILGAMEVKRRWESSAHPYIFFNPDHQTLTFLGFCVERRNGNILVPRTAQILKPNAVAKELFDGLERNNVDLSEDFESKTREEKIQKICAVMGNDDPRDPNPRYELTLDNVKKILAIQMRFRCGIPVVIMGETGCGKTYLVKFMCDLQIPASQHAKIKNLILMKVHGGTTAQDIERKVREAQKLAEDNKHRNVDTVLFFDEANTTDAIGLIKEIMCDGSLNGEILNANDVRLRFIAAVNPYRKHSSRMIEKLEAAGLGYNVKADDTLDKFGSIPMRHLVYRVKALPPSMIPLVWDFGRLSSDVEEKYICQMIYEYDLLRGTGFEEAIARVLVKCQDFMRLQKDECGFVSLRDVDRVLTVMSWFFQKHQLLREINSNRPIIESRSLQSSTESYMAVDSRTSLDSSVSSGSAASLSNLLALDNMTWSLVLALGVCYHAGLQPRKRAEFRRVVASHFRHPLVLPQGERQMLEEIESCQRVIVESLKDHLPENIARNHALKENIFMMVVCLDQRIPLFLVGKPGSSKSLAKVVVADAMQGDSAKSKLFKTLKHVHMVSFQCSPLSTPEGIVAIFRQCARFQKNKNLDKFVSVAVLDEVGLAEDSKHMPLKALHPLLEEGCDVDEKKEKEEKEREVYRSGASVTDKKKDEDYRRCAFIGISNWALDPAKMNRGIHVQRGVPDRKELEDSARGILQHDQQVTQAVTTWIGPLAAAYLKISEDPKVPREFFGLRDFYSLMKMIAYFAFEQRGVPTSNQVRHAILRNFGGVESLNVMSVFERQLHSLRSSENTSPHGPPCDAIGLIDSSLTGSFTKSGGESRYLLILTENDTALSLVQSKLQNSKPEVIFGSFFPKDLEYTQVCRNINRIKVCMEAGKTVILLNLENLYESLYDALNQYYVYLGRKRFVDLGLGTHRVKCRVHEKFRLIVIADQHDVLMKFPIPLINRLEKHYVKMSSILNERQQGIVTKLCRWASNFVEKPQLPSATRARMGRSSTDDCLEPEDAFVGFSTDAVAAVLLQIPSKDQDILQDSQLLKKAKEVLLLSATPDAILRVKQSRLSSEYDEIFCNYFEKENHDCFSDLINNVIKKRPSEDLFLQVTTHYRLLSRDDVNQIRGQLGSTFGLLKVIYALQAIDTEQQFSRDIRDFYRCTENTELDSLLIVQCEAGHENMKLISCARYILWREYNDSQSRLEDSSVPVSGRRSMRHVVLMVQLQRKAKFFGFHGAHWTCVHVDDLHSRPSHLPAIENMHRKAISQVLESGLPDSQQATPSSGAASGTNLTKGTFDTYELLRSCLHEAVSRLSDSTDGRNPGPANHEKRSRARKRLALLIDLFSSHQHQVRSRFQEVFSRFLIRLMSLYENDRLSPEMRVQWLFVDAASMQNVIKFGTFRRSLENCLERRIASFFATIVAFLDTNGNLDLLAPLTSKDDHWVSRLWLDIFAGVSLFSSDLAQALASTGVQKSEVPVICTSASNESFSPRFPFSWLLKGQLDAMIVQLKDSPETFQDLHNRMLLWLAMDRTFGCITREAENERIDMVESYLHDFVHLAFPCKGSRPELHEIMSKSLWQIMVATNRQTLPGIHLCYSEIQQRMQRLRKLIDLDVLDPRSAEVDPLEKEVLDYVKKLETSEVVSDLAALRISLDRLEPSISKKELFGWAAKMHKCHMLVEEVLSDVGNGTEDVERPALWLTCREHWWRYVVLLLFLEMVVHRSRMHPDLSQLLDDDTVRLLSQRLVSNSNFKQMAALKNLEGFLEYCNKQVVTIIYGKHFLDNVCCSGDHAVKDPTLLPCQHPICGSCLQLVICNQKEESRCPIATCNRRIPLEFARLPRIDFDDEYSAKVQRHQIFKQLLNSFYVRVLVELVFSGNDPPNAAVIQHILRYVTSEHRTGDRTFMHTKQLSPFIDITLIDPTPVIRSFLLQLLLRTSEGLVKDHLSQYFNDMTTVTECLGSHVVLEFCILFITCFEDYVVEKTLGNNATSTTLAVSREACDYIRHTLDPNGQTRTLFDGVMLVDVDSLRTIAVLRLCLTIGADVICRHLLTTPQHSASRDFFAVSQLLSGICDYAENKGNSWPRRFLAKQIVRRYGAIVFHAASSAQHLRYIIPKELQQTAGRAPLSDLFVIGLNKEVYEEMRTAVAHCVLDAKMDALPNVIKGRQSAEAEMDLHCVLAMCSVFIRNYFEDNSASCMGDEVKTMVERYAAQQWPEAKVLQQLIGGIVKNSLTDKLQIVMGSSLGDVMVVMLLHRLAASLLVKEKKSSAIVNPLTKIIATPLEMQKAFFPTMPHDPFLEVREVIKTTSSDSENLLPYACPNGHIYYIGNCGRAYQLSKCPECGSVIGGTGHITADGNRDVKLGEDNTKPGHILGSAGATKQIIPERELTPQSCIIMRTVLHSALYVSAVVNGKEQVEHLVHPRPENLLQFLWNHLTHDIECLQLALSKSFDDCLIFLHTVVARLVILDEEDDCSWSSHDGRRTWESKVQKCLLLPLCQEADRIVAEGAAAVHTNVDSSAGAMALARLLDESHTESNAEDQSSAVNLGTVLNSAAVWRYRESPSVDHFINRFENSNSFDTPLNNERSHKYSALKLFLRTRVQLAAVRFLPDILLLLSSLSREFGRKIDVATANELSIGQFLGKYVEDRKSYYRPLLDSFYEAWNAVSGRLGQHTFWYGRRRLNMPTEACAVVKASDASPLCMLLPAMTGLGLCTLTLVTYLAKMQNDFLSEYARISREGLQEDTPLLSIVPVQLIAFVGNDDLLPIILANCEYSLKAGEGMSLQYNFESIQSQIIDRFVRHKTPILLSSEENGVDAIQCFIFREDLRNGNQFEKLHKILKQKPLPVQLKESMQKEYNGKLSELSDMLVVIDQAVGFLVTSAFSDDSNVPLVRYLQTVLRMPDISANVMWTPLRDNCYPCHVRAVWLLLSLERAKALTKNKQECFDDLETAYRLPIGEQESAAVNLVNSLKKQKHEMIVEKVSEILYEFIVLELACKRRKPIADSDADDVLLLPSFPLFCTLSEYAEKTAESTGIGESFIANLKTLGQDHADLRLEHSAAVWRMICNL